MQSDDILNALGQLPTAASSSSSSASVPPSLSTGGHPSFSYDISSVFRTLSDVKDEAPDMHHLSHPSAHAPYPPTLPNEVSIKSEVPSHSSSHYSVVDYASSMPSTTSSLLAPSPSPSLPPLRAPSSVASTPVHYPIPSSSANFMPQMPMGMGQPPQSIPQHLQQGQGAYGSPQHPMPLPAHSQQSPHQHSNMYPLARYYSDVQQAYPAASQQVYQSPASSAPSHFSPNATSPWYQVPELEPVSRPYKPCVVCNDRSSGYHYGVSSCEGCKGFFRRSVQKNLQYVCNKDKSCIINKVTRNRCQYCRLHKCFSMGMSREAVRNDRNRKKKDSSSSLEGADQQASSTSEAIELSPDDVALLEAIREAHQSTFPMPQQVEVVNEVREEDRLGLWDKIEELSTQGVKRIVHFAKRVPNFRDVKQGDQALLLRSAVMELVLLRMASRYDPEEDSVLFSTGLRLTRCALQALGFDDITDTVVLFAQKMASMQVDQLEFAILASVCLCSGDRSGLEEPRAVDRIQERILDLFRRYVKKTYPDQPRRFAKLLMKLTDLRGISVKGGDRIFHFIKTKSEGEMPPLIVELLNRDENVCIP